MRETCECGTEVELDYDPPTQEYAGACVQGGLWIGECPHCDEIVSVKDCDDFNVRENTRGW